MFEVGDLLFEKSYHNLGVVIDTYDQTYRVHWLTSRKPFIFDYEYKRYRYAHEKLA